MKTVVLLISNFIELNFFLCKNNGVEVPYQMLLALGVSFETLLEKATNRICQLSVHGIRRKFFLKSTDKLHFNIFFLSHFPSVSIWRMNRFKNFVCAH